MENIQFIETYFTEEKIESLFFIILGIISVSLSFVFLLIIKYSFYKGFAYPLLIIGFIQLMVGGIIYVRSPKDINRVNSIVIETPEKITTEELPRMKNVMKSFELYKWVELILIISGLLLFIVFFTSNLRFWKGFGLSLCIQAAIMLALDLIAANRATVYIEELLKF